MTMTSLTLQLTYLDEEQAVFGFEGCLNEERRLDLTHDEWADMGKPVEIEVSGA